MERNDRTGEAEDEVTMYWICAGCGGAVADLYAGHDASCVECSGQIWLPVLTGSNGVRGVEKEPWETMAILEEQIGEDVADEGFRLADLDEEFMQRHEDLENPYEEF